MNKDPDPISKSEKEGPGHRTPNTRLRQRASPSSESDPVTHRRSPPDAGTAVIGRSARPVDAWSVLEPLIRRSHWLPLGGILLAVIGAAAAAAFWNTSYTATAQLIRHTPPLAEPSFQPRSLTPQALTTLMLAPDTLGKVGARVRPSLSARELADRVKVTHERNSEITSVSVSGLRLEETVNLANWLCRETVELTRELQRRDAAESLAVVKLQLAERNKDLETLKKNLSQAAPPASTPESRPPEPSLAAERIQNARLQLTELLARYTELHPEVIQQRSTLKALEAEYSIDLPANNSSTPQDSSPAAPSAESSTATTAEYEALREQLHALETDRSSLLNQRRNIQMWVDDPPGSLRAFLEATPGEAIVHSSHLKVSAVAVFCGLLGMFAAAAMVLLIEFLDDRIKTPADVKRVTRLPVLASLGNLRQLSSAEQQDWAFRTWTALQNRLSKSANHGMVCGITSTSTAEGRSTWVRLLAQAASQRGFRVLTIATRPNGKPHHSAKNPPSESLPAPAGTALTSSVLATPSKVAEKLMGPNPEPLVHILLPGWVWNLDRRLEWQAALNAWRTIDNLVILVELPPASIPESVLLAENLPNLIWLSESGRSDATETHRQLQTLRHARCNLVGAVLNREPPPPVKHRFARWIETAA